MKKCKICLSIAGMDEAFAKMYGTLRTYADVQIADLEHFSLEGTDVFIGKKLPAEKLAETGVWLMNEGVPVLQLSAERGDLETAFIDML